MTMRVDARGMGCPKPVMMAEEALENIIEGTVEVLVDNEASMRNLSKFARKNALYSEAEQVDGYWKVRIAKGYSCETAAPEAVALEGKEAEEEAGQKDLLLVIGSDVMGKEEDLGRVLMKGFLETLKVTRELPHTIFFLNAGVRLTTVDGEVAPVLKAMEDMGVEIYSCGTCLKHYGLEDSLKVGRRGSSDIIVEGLKDFKKIVWL
jgi:selenium metabolism protein YedF